MTLALALLLIGQCSDGSCWAPATPRYVIQQPSIVPGSQHPYAAGESHWDGPQVDTSRLPLRSVCRITMTDRDRTYSHGSGTLVASDLVITNHHVVRDSDRPGVVTFADGSTSRGAVIDYDMGADLAVLQLDPPASVPPVELADDNPPAGSTLVIAGYGRGQFATQAGVATYSQANPWIVVRGANAREGDSGGPIFTTAGKLGGVLWGSNSGTYGAPCRSLRRLLDRVRRWRRPTADAASQQPTLPPGQWPQQPFPSGSSGASDSSPVNQAPLPGPVVSAPNEDTSPLSPGKASSDSVADGPRSNRSPDVMAAPVSSGALVSRPVVQRALGAGLSFLGMEIPTIVALLGAGATGGVGGPLAIWLARLAAGKLLSTVKGSTPAEMPVGAGMPNLFQPTMMPQAQQQVNPYAPPQTVVVQSTPPSQPPVFVPTQVENPELAALKQALLTFGEQHPNNAKAVNLIYSFRDQCLTRN